MIRYVTRRPRPKLLWDDVLREEETGARSTVTVHEPEDDPQPTGLLDAQGNDVNELEFFGRVWAGASVDLVIISAGVKGGALIVLGEDYGEGASVIQERSYAYAMKSSMWLMDPRPQTIIAVDCGWPVETGLLSACVADDPTRAFEGPYPLHEVATMLRDAGMDPLAEYGPELLSPEEFAAHRAHHPVDDARLSVRCALRAMKRLREAGVGP